MRLKGTLLGFCLEYFWLLLTTVDDVVVDRVGSCLVRCLALFCFELQE